jgi:nicotinate-nucleotide adenylyltransferase
MKIGLFFGSFNPVHVGHMIIASHMAQYTDLDQVWMVISPQNPFKNKASLANNNDRYHLLRLAIGDNQKIKASNVEFSLTIPSYTIDTLVYLKEKYPKYEFALIMGEDNLENLHKWKNFTVILDNYDIYVYKRTGYNTNDYNNHPTVKFMDLPLLEISATQIRKAIRDGKSVQYLVPDSVYKYLENSTMYRNVP